MTFEHVTFMFSDCFSISSCLSSKNSVMNSSHYLMCLVHTRHQMGVSNKSFGQEIKSPLMSSFCCKFIKFKWPVRAETCQGPRKIGE
jgi:hypothetical protein